MREIKFRAWDKVEKKMFIPARLSFKDELYQEFYNDSCGGNEHPFSYINLMQYTGLKDKNGKEIYEGDVVRYKAFEIWYARKVYFDTELCQFGLHSSNFLFHNQFSDNLEIIGNIYENPELLK